MVQESIPAHKCNVLDFCMCGNTKILFCIFCKNVVGYQKQEQQIRLSVSILGITDNSMKEYSDEIKQQMK